MEFCPTSATILAYGPSKPSSLSNHVSSSIKWEHKIQFLLGGTVNRNETGMHTMFYSMAGQYFEILTDFLLKKKKSVHLLMSCGQSPHSGNSQTMQQALPQGKNDTAELREGRNPILAFEF